MERTHNRLTIPKISRQLEAGYYPDGGGLYLQVTVTGAKSWIYQFSLMKRRREMGLGPFPDIALAKARELAAAARGVVKQGRDPIEERRAEQAAQKLAAARSITFKMAAEQFLADNSTVWSNAKHSSQWSSTLTINAP